jgi:hypothetical protein
MLTLGWERKGCAVIKAKKKISKKEFVKRFTDLAVKHLSQLPPEEQETRIKAFEHRAATISRDIRPTPSRISETPAIRLSARGREVR